MEQTRKVSILGDLMKKHVPKKKQTYVIGTRKEPTGTKETRKRKDVEEMAKMAEDSGSAFPVEEVEDKSRQPKIVDKRQQGFDRNAFLRKLGKTQDKQSRITREQEDEQVEKMFDDERGDEGDEGEEGEEMDRILEDARGEEGEDEEMDRILEEDAMKKAEQTRDVPKGTTRTKRTVTKSRKPAKDDADEDEEKPTRRKTSTVKRTKDVREAEKRVEVDPSEIIIDGEPLTKRLPRRKRNADSNDAIGIPHIRLSRYYMTNREKFINFINQAFSEYKDELRDQDEVTCESRSADDDGFFTLMTHQKIVRDYLTNYTPYRGLLLYHGLGSGKTCSSIAIAEGLKTKRQVIVMTPASLRTNYLEELKKCGDPLYKKNQHWEYVSLEGRDDIRQPLADFMGVSQSDIRKGAWLVDAKKQPNYESLSTINQESIDKQLNKMITSKYQFISYNGITNRMFNRMTNDGVVNIFDNKVIIIDEVHNFVSRIVNKLSASAKVRENNVAIKIYNMILRAQNSRLVFLSGTPIINYPNELAVLFNMLRGYIQTWEFKLRAEKTGKGNDKLNEQAIQKVFQKVFVGDYVSYSPTSKKVVITRNPFGFVSRYKGDEYKGVSLDERGEISDEEFIKMIQKALQKYSRDGTYTLSIEGGVSKIAKINHKALPDDYDSFKDYFLKENGDVKNRMLFQRRIIGLTSYYRSAQEQLMPSFDKNKDIHIVEVDMSSYQLSIYEKERRPERKEEKGMMMKKGSEDIYDMTNSTYRVFSRAACNFVFPEGMERPKPREGRTTLEEPEEPEEVDLQDIETDEQLGDGPEDYKTRIRRAIDSLRDSDKMVIQYEGDEISRETGLGKYSPKFATIITNLLDEEKAGCHLVYSQFRSVEGIELLTVAMNANGFTRFNIKKEENGKWTIDVDKEAVREGKPMYALYTGTESKEEREIIRNFFNSNWELVPSRIVRKIQKLRTSENRNMLGEFVSVFMITASGAEGISLRNTRYVHIVEPHWHPVRIEQVIGRARRICSHQELPEELRTVEVYMYLMHIQPEMITEQDYVNMRLRDKSRFDHRTVITSDEYLHEVSTVKEKTNEQLLESIKSSAMDCMIHGNEETSCMTFGNVEGASYAYTPSYKNEQRDEIRNINTKTLKWKGRELKVKKKDQNGRQLLDKEGNPMYTRYIMKQGTDELYDYDSYVNSTKTGANPLRVGTLKQRGDKKVIELV